VKALFTLIIIWACFGLNARAQTTAPKADEPFKLKPFSNDSIWRLPKTPNTLNQLPLAGFNAPAVTLNNLLKAVPGNTMLVCSTMPVKRLGGNNKMPVARAGSVGDNMNKHVIVINPLAEVPKP